jgi:hypothetical protein
LKKIVCLFLCAIAVFFCSVSAAALTVGYSPYTVDLGDGLVFWVIDTKQNHPDPEAFGISASGLYENGELLYTVDTSRAWGTNFYFSDDAMTFIHVIGGERATINFYDKGVHKHQYEVLSLLKGGNPSLLRGHDTLGYPWVRWTLPGTSTNYDRKNNIVSFVTIENTTVTFDLSTGLILSKEESPVVRYNNRKNNTVIFTTLENGIITIDLSTGFPFAEGESSEVEQKNYEVIVIAVSVAICATNALLFAIKKIHSKITIWQ